MVTGEKASNLCSSNVSDCLHPCWQRCVKFYFGRKCFTMTTLCYIFLQKNVVCQWLPLPMFTILVLTILYTLTILLWEMCSSSSWTSSSTVHKFTHYDVWPVRNGCYQILFNDLLLTAIAQHSVWSEITSHSQQHCNSRTVYFFFVFSSVVDFTFYFTAFLCTSKWWWWLSVTDNSKQQIICTHSKQCVGVLNKE